MMSNLVSTLSNPTEHQNPIEQFAILAKKIRELCLSYYQILRRLIKGRCVRCALGLNYVNSIRAPTPPLLHSRYSGEQILDIKKRRTSNLRKLLDRRMRENTKANS